MPVPCSLHARSMPVHATFSIKMASRAVQMASRRSKRSPRAIKMRSRRFKSHSRGPRYNLKPCYIDFPLQKVLPGSEKSLKSMQLSSKIKVSLIHLRLFRGLDFGPSLRLNLLSRMILELPKCVQDGSKTALRAPKTRARAPETRPRAP